MKTYKKYSQAEIAKELSLIGFIIADAIREQLYEVTGSAYMAMLEVVAGMAQQFIDKNADTNWEDAEEDWDEMVFQPSLSVIGLTGIIRSWINLVNYYLMAWWTESGER
jgi:endonuclease V-like protein UPF0215 family